MPVLPTRLDPRGASYARNRAAMERLLAALQAQHARALGGGGPAYVERHRKRGKLLARERIDLLLDQDAPFLELSPLAGLPQEDPPGAGLVTGIGPIEGVECVISANDPTVKGGASGPATVAKALRALQIAAQNRLPYVSLTESAGADLPRQAEIFVPGGATFRALTQLSAAGIPTIALVFGSSTAGGAYVPGMSDWTVFVKGSAKVFLGGPPLVKMAIDEDADEESLGGAEMHARTSGLADWLAEDERDALRLGRQIVRGLGWRKLGPGPSRPAEPPRYAEEELLGVVPEDLAEPFEVREVLARLLDGSRLDEHKPLYGTTLVTGFGSLCGFPLGVIANNGILFAQESQKAAHFIQLCNRLDTPILFVQNITGFMVGTRYEQGGIIKDGAKMINAVANSTVPHLTLMVGASYGAGNYAMAGRAYQPRLLFTWPNHRIAVMGARQASGVLSIVQRQKAKAEGKPFDEQADAQMRAALEGKIDQESTALYASGRLWDDGILDPHHTRTALGVALSAAHSNVVQGARAFGVFRM